jgi:hypothetical protein
MRPDRELRTAETGYYRTEAEVRRLEDLQRNGLARVRRIEEGVKSVYAEPARALKDLHEHRQLYGANETARVLREAPERFGTLLHTRSGRFLGSLLPGSDAYARGHARYVAAELRDADWAFGDLPSPRDVELARGRVKEAATVWDAARTARDRSGDVHVEVDSLRREAAIHLRFLRTGDPARDKQIERRLGVMVPASGLSLLTSAMRIARELDPDREPDRNRGMSL